MTPAFRPPGLPENIGTPRPGPEVDKLVIELSFNALMPEEEPPPPEGEVYDERTRVGELIRLERAQPENPQAPPANETPTDPVDPTPEAPADPPKEEAGRSCEYCPDPNCDGKVHPLPPMKAPPGGALAAPPTTGPTGPR